MSTEGGPELAETEPTDRREGETDIGPVEARCPYCRTRDVAVDEVNVCGKCGHWFRVVLP